MIQIKRVYEKYYVKEGLHIFVDRLWPRGVRKSTPNVDIWIKNIAPSNELRKWYAHDPSKWEEFKKRYKRELDGNQKFVEKILDVVRKNSAVTLVYAAKEEQFNNAVVLKEYIEKALIKGNKQKHETAKRDIHPDSVVVRSHI